MDNGRYLVLLTDKKIESFEITRDIADNYIESQKEIANSFNQSIWTPYLENVVNRNFSFPEVRADTYDNTISNVVDNFVTAARLANKTVFANAELISILLYIVTTGKK